MGRIARDRDRAVLRYEWSSLTGMEPGEHGAEVASISRRKGEVPLRGDAALPRVADLEDGGVLAILVERVD